MLETTPMTISPRRAAMLPPPLPTAKPVTRAMTTMMRISLVASSRKAEVAGSSTRMKTSSCVRYDCRTSSGVGRIRERRGCRRDGPAGRLVTPEAREELRTAVDDVRHEMADIAEEGPDRVGSTPRVAVDEDDDECDRQVDEPLLQIDLHRHRSSRAVAAARQFPPRKHSTRHGHRGQPAHLWTRTSQILEAHFSGTTLAQRSHTAQLCHRWWQR